MLLFAVHELIARADEIPDPLAARRVVRREEIGQPLPREVGGD